MNALGIGTVPILMLIYPAVWKEGLTALQQPGYCSCDTWLLLMLIVNIVALFLIVSFLQQTLAPLKAELEINEKK